MHDKIPEPVFCSDLDSKIIESRFWKIYLGGGLSFLNILS